MISELNNIIVNFYLDNYTWKSLIKRISNNNYDYDRKNIIHELSGLLNIQVSKFYQDKFQKWIECWSLRQGNLFHFNKQEMIKYVYHLSNEYTIYWDNAWADDWNEDVTSSVNILINDKVNITISFDKLNFNASTCTIIDDEVAYEGYDYIYEAKHVLFHLNIPCQHKNIHGRFKALIEQMPVLKMIPLL